MLRFFLCFSIVCIFISSVFAQDLQQEDKEEKRQFKIGRYEDYPAGTVRYIDEAKVYIISDEEGIYALSAECERGRGIVEKRKVGFLCRKNGALYRDDGTAYYIASKDLEWFRIRQDSEGNLIVDKEEILPKGEKFKK